MIKKIILLVLIFSGIIGCNKQAPLKATEIKILSRHTIDQSIKEKLFTTISDDSSIEPIVNALHESKLWDGIIPGNAQFTFQITYNRAYDSDGHTWVSYLLWLAPEGESSVLLNETDKGSEFILSPHATHVLREIVKKMGANI